MLEELRKRLEVSAGAERRSLNAEIVARLEQSYAQTGRGNVQDRLEAVVARLDALVGPRERGPYANETAEQRLTRLFALAEDYRKSAERHDARGAHDMAAQTRGFAEEIQREATALAQEQRRGRRRLQTDEQYRASLCSTAEGYRRNAERHEKRGAYDRAAEMRKLADEMEREAAALTVRQTSGAPVSNQEPELPMPQPHHRQAK